MSLSKVLEVTCGKLGHTDNSSGSNWVTYWNAYDPNINTRVNSIGDSY